MNTIPVSVANRPLGLAHHLKTVADQIERGILQYDWQDQHRCNCGLVAQSALGISGNDLAEEVESLTSDEVLTWTEMAQHHCPITGRPMGEVFGKLHDAGLIFGDFAELENLSNPEVLARIQAESPSGQRRVVKKRWFRDPVVHFEPYTVTRRIVRDDRDSLVLYLKTWSAMIEDFHATRYNLEAVELRPLVVAK